jgi:simple sugar transport system permease protein
VIGRQRLEAIALEIGVAIASVALSLVFGSILIVMRGHSPIEVYAVLFREALGSASGLAQVSFKATTLIFTGVAAGFAFRAGMFNIGGEGQLYLGAFCAALAGLWLPEQTPGLVAVLLVCSAAFMGGALAASIPAVLKATRGTHEVINTMMMNFIIISVVNWLLQYFRESEEVVRTRAVPVSWRFEVFLRGFDGNASLYVAIAASILIWYLLDRTRTGYELRAVGLNPKAAEYGGVSIARATILSLVLSGGIAGLGGINFVLGSPGYFEQHFAPFQGYLGIAVTLLARNHPLGIVLAAFLFGVMSEGSQAIQEFVPKEIGSILQAITVVFVILGSKVLERSIASRREKGSERK